MKHHKEREVVSIGLPLGFHAGSGRYNGSHNNRLHFPVIMLMHLNCKVPKGLF